VNPLEKARALGARPRTILAAYLATATVVTLQMYLRHTYGNFLIFRLSFEHLLSGEDLYLRYPETHLDVFKYSPTFSLLFAPFAAVPVPVGMLAWCLVNAWVLFEGLRRFPYFSGSRRVLALWLCLVEAVGALQHMQTNALIAGCLLLAFAELERQRLGRGTLLVLLTVYIKLVGGVGLALCAFVHRKARAAAVVAGWTVLLAALPLAVASPQRLAGLYRSWVESLRADHSVSYGYSVMGILHTWFGLDPDKVLVLGAGAALMALPFLRVRAYREPVFRAHALAALLIWCVIFNHKAEGPTYVIAMAGVVVWYGVGSRSRLDTALLVLAFALVSLAPSDLSPRVVRDRYVGERALKAVPCVLVWAKCILEMLTMRLSPAASPSLEAPASRAA